MRAGLRLALAAGLGLLVWLAPAPEGVSAQAWQLFAIFVATLLGILLQPLPMGAVALLGLAALTLTGTLTPGQALSGFGNRIIWLVLMAFFIARGVIKTGLGTRIAYEFVKRLGGRTLGLAYSLLATDLVLAPAIPSITARAGAVLYPILRSVAAAYGSHPGKGTERRVGAFLVQSSFQGHLVTSAMFLTAMAANPLVAQLAGDLGAEITWSLWALAALLPGLASLLVLPLILYRLYPPELRETPEAPAMARARLAEMGPLGRDEWIVLLTFALLLLLWIFGGRLGVHSTVAALLGLAILLVSRVLSWEEVLGERAAWDTFIWLSTLVMMASFLAELGLVGWFAGAVGSLFSGMSWPPAFLALALIYFYSHYFFASNTAHISSLYAPFLAVGISVGTLVNIALWLGLGALWWKLLGLW